MIVSDKYKFQFIHIPKTGGTAVTQALAPHIRSEYRNAWYPKTQEDGRKGWQIAFHRDHMHSTFREATAFLRKGYFTFSIIRNPWERVVSLWKRFANGKPMKDFLKEIKDHEWPTPSRVLSWNQKKWIERSDGKPAMDFICRTEHLAEDLDGVREILKLPKLELIRFNTAAYHFGDERTRFDLFTSNDEIQLAAEIYADDIETFGFTFEKEEKKDDASSH